MAEKSQMFASSSLSRSSLGVHLGRRDCTQSWYSVEVKRAWSAELSWGIVEL